MVKKQQPVTHCIGLNLISNKQIDEELACKYQCSKAAYVADILPDTKFKVKVKWEWNILKQKMQWIICKAELVSPGGPFIVKFTCKKHNEILFQQQKVLAHNKIKQMKKKYKAKDQVSNNERDEKI